MSEPVIIHESRDWLVLNKPAGWHSVSPGKRRAAQIKQRGGQIEPNVQDWLRERFEWARELTDAGLVHRLDFETSGCLVAATTASAHARLSAAFRADGVEKTYLADVAGDIAPHGTFQLYFSSRYKRSKKVTVESRGEAAHEGRCAWRVVRALGNGLSRIEVKLIGPGRRHQIRAGLAHLGFPIAGDNLYGGPATGDRMLHLHAWSVAIEGLQIQCNPPW